MRITAVGADGEFSSAFPGIAGRDYQLLAHCEQRKRADGPGSIHPPGWQDYLER